MMLSSYGLALASLAFVISRFLERLPYVLAGVLNLIGAISSVSVSGS